MRHSMMSSFAATEETIEEEEEGIPICLMQSIETAWNPKLHAESNTCQWNEFKTASTVRW